MITKTTIAFLCAVMQIVQSWTINLREQLHFRAGRCVTANQCRKIDMQGDWIDGTESKLNSQILGIDKIVRSATFFKSQWIEKSGNFVLRPTGPVKPIGVIHFLGGAFVGAAPHLTYAYLLYLLAKQGYIVVATPYRLNLDYISVCGAVVNKFDTIARELAAEFGPLPVIGIGHSCGALLHTYITSLFPDTPRAVNILISYNNKPAADAIPAFNELVVPISKRLMSNTRESEAFRSNLLSMRTYAQRFVKEFVDSNSAPVALKDVYPLVEQSLEMVDQIPEVLQEIASGQREFSPSPADTKEACRRMYRARNTLVLKFATDSIDESEDIVKVLREANTIMRMKRPMVEMQVDFKVLSGSHITPLTPDLAMLDSLGFDTSGIPDSLNPGKSQAVINLRRTIDDVSNEIIQYLDSAVRQSTI